MPIDDERLLAWIDGALDDADAAAVAAAVAANPELAARAAAHRAVAERLRAGFKTLLTDPVPAALATAARRGAGTVTDLSSARTARDARKTARDAQRPTPPARRFALPQWAAIAATLAVGIVAGRMSQDVGPQPLIAQHGAGLEARGQLAAALDSQLASAPTDGGVRVMVSFRAHDGRICRSWSLAAQSGIACRTGPRWQVTAAVAAPVEGKGGHRSTYRMAASGDPQLLTLIDGMIDGAPFDAAQEKQASHRGWR